MTTPDRHDESAATLEASLSALAATIRDAGESLLDLQEALAKLRVVSEPRLARDVQAEVAACLGKASQRAG